MRMDLKNILFIFSWSLFNISSIFAQGPTNLSDMNWIKTATKEEVLSFISRSNFNPEIKSDYDENYLHYAAQNTDEEVAKLFMKAGVPYEKDSSSWSFTAAMYAAGNSNEKVLELFLDNGVFPSQSRDYDRRQNKGISPLLICASLNENPKVTAL